MENSYFLLGARQYDPKIGRFLSVDPCSHSRGWESFANYNPYHYCYNNPVSFKDPTGLAPEGEKEDELLGDKQKEDELQSLQYGLVIKIYPGGSSPICAVEWIEQTVWFGNEGMTLNKFRMLNAEWFADKLSFLETLSEGGGGGGSYGHGGEVDNFSTPGVSPTSSNYSNRTGTTQSTSGLPIIVRNLSEGKVTDAQINNKVNGFFSSLQQVDIGLYNSFIESQNQLSITVMSQRNISFLQLLNKQKVWEYIIGLFMSEDSWLNQEITNINYLWLNSPNTIYMASELINDDDAYFSNQGIAYQRYRTFFEMLNPFNGSGNTFDITPTFNIAFAHEFFHFMDYTTNCLRYLSSWYSQGCYPNTWLEWNAFRFMKLFHDATNNAGYKFAMPGFSLY